jgi:hypothetical protein
VKITVQDLRREQEARQDNFEIMLRRQGWQLIQHRPVHTDSRVIRVFQDGSPNGTEHDTITFYEAFGDNTFRKLLRHIFFHKRCTPDELKRICGSEQKLSKYLILLIDTESRIDQQVEMINRFRTGGDPLSAQDARHSLYWGARHIYAINSKVSIADSLSAVLRLYYSKIRHIAFWRMSLE